MYHLLSGDLNMNIEYILACNDLGVHICGSEKGPGKVYTAIKGKYNFPVHTVQKELIAKSFDKNDRAKNLVYVNNFNKKLFDTVSSVLDSNSLPITFGGDHSIAIASGLASIKKYSNLGIIWIDSHADYHNFDTTISGNLHGLPFAALTGYPHTEKLTNKLSNIFFNPKNAVLVGARDMESEEIVNLKNAGVTIFTTEDLNKFGIEKIMKEAISIATKNTNGIHISYDVDVIDPLVATGVSVPANDGITEVQAYKIMDKLKESRNKIKSMDIVEYNPKFDKNNTTLNIVKNLIEKFI